MNGEIRKKRKWESGIDAGGAAVEDGLLACEVAKGQEGDYDAVVEPVAETI